MLKKSNQLLKNKKILKMKESDIMRILDKATTKNYEVEGIVLNKKTVGEVYEKFFKEKIENLINKKDNGFIIPYININGENAKNYSKEKLVNFFKENGFFEIHYLFGGDNFEICYTSNNYLCQLNDIFIKDPFLESLNLEVGYRNHFGGYPIKLSEEYDYPENKEFSEYYIFNDGKYYRNKEIVKYLEVLNKNIVEILEREYNDISRYFSRNAERIAEKKQIKFSFETSCFDFLKNQKFEYEVNQKRYVFTTLEAVIKNLIKIFKEDNYLKFPNKFIGKEDILNFKYGDFFISLDQYNNGTYYNETKYITKEIFNKYLEKEKK